MAVQIPELKRFASQPEASVGRMQVDIPDGTKGVSQVSNELEKLAQTEITQLDKEEDYANDTQSMSVSNQYEMGLKGELERARKVKGDPTQAYVQFQENAKKQRDAYLTQYEGSSPRLKQAIEARLNKVDYRLYDTASIAQASQYATFEKETTQARVELHKQGLLDALPTLAAGGDTKFNGVDTEIDGIRQTLFNAAVKNGSAEYKDPVTGEMRPSPLLKEEWSKAIGEAVTNGVAALNASGKPEEAQMLIDRYASDIDAKTRSKLLADKKEASKQNLSYGVSDKLRSLPESVAFARLDKMDLDPEIRYKAAAQLRTHYRHQDYRIDRAKKQADDHVLGYVLQKNQSDQPILSAEELEMDPQFQQFKGRASAKGLKAAMQLAEAPLVSDPEAKIEVQNSLANGSFFKLKPTEMNALIAPLSKKDRSLYTSQWNAANTDTSGESQRKVTYANKELQRQMIRLGVIKDGPANYRSKAERQKIADFTHQLNEDLQHVPANATTNDQNKFIADRVADYAKGRSFAPPKEVQRIESSPVKKKTAPPPAPTASVMTMDQKKEAARKFLEQKGRPWTKADGPDALKKAYEGKL